MVVLSRENHTDEGDQRRITTRGSERLQTALYSERLYPLSKAQVQGQSYFAASYSLRFSFCVSPVFPKTTRKHGDG